MANLKVMSAGAVAAMVTGLGEAFTRANGYGFDPQFATAGVLRERIAGSEKADLVILPDSVIADFDKQGLFVPGSIKDLGRTRTGVCIKDGAPKPDISTVEAFKQALLTAKGVSYSDPAGGGSSGKVFAKQLEKLGIADEIAKKSHLKKRGFLVAEAVVSGEADIGTTFISEILTVKGAANLGPLPGWLDNANTYTAAIMKSSTQQDETRALLVALSKPGSRAQWTAAGLEPAF